MKIGIPCMKCSLNPSQQVNKKTGKAAKTCGVSSAWKEMNDERMGRDTTIDKNLTHHNVWMDGSTADDVTKVVQTEIDRINEERRANGLRAMRKVGMEREQVIESLRQAIVNLFKDNRIEKMHDNSYELAKNYLSENVQEMWAKLLSWK